MTKTAFIAIDNFGREAKLYVTVSYVDTSTLSGGRDRIVGSKRISDSSGLPVTYVEKGRYRTMQGVELHSADYDAP